MADDQKTLSIEGMETVEGRAILMEALKIIQFVGWHDFSLVDLARHADYSLDMVYEIYPTKGDIITAFIHKVNKEVLRDLDKDDLLEDPRDLIFELVMRRFEALKPHKEVVRSLWIQRWRDPLTFLCVAPSGIHSMRWMLNAAGYDISGPCGLIRVQVFGLFYLSVMSDWLEDDTADQAKTMAAIDRMLKRLVPYL
jgi:ubiquinone biosynthesis protein COQ9